MGQAICGDFGSASVLRFMVLGAVSSSLHPLERIAAQWRTQVLADDEAYSSSCYNWAGQLLGAVFMPKRRSGAPLRLYSMTSRREAARADVPAEWMYQLADMGEDEHAEANRQKECEIKVILDTNPFPPAAGQITRYTPTSTKPSPGPSHTPLSPRKSLTPGPSHTAEMRGDAVVWMVEEVGLAKCIPGSIHPITPPQA
eukprot:Hpha_TRINITY_DN15716_c1_g1::TRINITY_DN15716_c1_g1_i1::g.37684::m.37684